MRKFLLGLALLAPAPLAAQTYVRQESSQVQSSGVGTGVVVATSNSSLFGVNAITGATAGYAVLYDSAAVPADGALDPTMIRWCLPIAANTGVYVPFFTPIKFYYGLSFFVSTTSCTTKIATSYGFVSVQVRVQ